MLRTITHRQLEELRLYSDLEPWEEERADQRAGSIVQAILATEKRGRRNRGTPPTVEECTLKFGMAAKKPAALEPARTAAEASRRAAAVKRTMDAHLAQQGKRKGGG